MKDVNPKWVGIVKALLPHGYELKLRNLKGATGAYAMHVKHIIAPPILDRHDLFVYLHEVGHIRNMHLHRAVEKVLPAWQVEYEADQYAIEVMRMYRIPIERATMTWHKSLVRTAIEREKEHDDIPEKVWRYAYGSHWRLARRTLLG